MTPQRLIMLVFFLQPLAFGNWLSRIPDVQADLDLGPAQMSIAFLGLPLGVVLTLPLGGRIEALLGARRLICLGFVLFLVVMLMPVFAGSLPHLVIALIVVGSVMSLLELGLNVAAAHIERTGGRLIMSTCHGFWSMGVATGSFAGTGLASLGLSPVMAMVLLCLATFPVALYAGSSLPDMQREAHEKTQGTSIFTLPSRTLTGICLFVFGIAMSEGAMGDWSGIYLRDVALADPGLTGLGYGIFAAFVAAGRFLGDGLKKRMGVVSLARLCGSLALGGVMILGIAQGVTATLACYAVIGFGVSVGFPLAVSAASDLKDRPAATNVALLSIMAMIGFLTGPVVIGFVAEHAGMRYGLTALLPALVVSLLATRSLRPRPASDSISEGQS